MLSARCASQFVRDKYTAKWGVQMTGMNFQTRSRRKRRN
ncbi:DUF6783 domain-containing protein [Ruminococcus sp. 5_1_39BFAA]